MPKNNITENINTNINLFSYGTLQYAEVQMATFGRLLQGHDDAMVGFKKEMVEITDKYVLEKSGDKFHPIVMKSDNKSDEVAGKVLKITYDELMSADKYEVSDYKRIEVTLKSGIKSLVYIKAE